MIENAVRLGTVAAIWIIWCLQHSLLNSEGPIRRTSILRSGIGPYYRLMYVLITIITLSLAIWATSEIKENHLWRWPDWLYPVQVGIWISAITMFWLSFRRLDPGRFLGMSAFMGTLGTECAVRRPRDHRNIWMHPTSSVLGRFDAAVGERSHRSGTDHYYRAVLLFDHWRPDRGVTTSDQDGGQISPLLRRSAGLYPENSSWTVRPVQKKRTRCMRKGNQSHMAFLPSIPRTDRILSCHVGFVRP